MNIADFCEQILCGEALQDKLWTPDEITFEDRPIHKNLPSLPARTAELSFNTKASIQLPGLSQLEEPKHRGILLHFFLNHELLALELMALMLLRFPEAPVSFKKGLLKTMKEEQKHAQLYLELMDDYGVRAGDVPVNKFFWDCLSGVENLQQFVAGMSLTFEQANLDFSLFYKQAFEKIGDHRAATVLQTVYDEEITHVCHGLAWFRRWKHKGLSDWQEYAKILEIPLSPSRGKGPLFDLVGRQKAGFDKEFIDNMKVTSMSRGRSPDVFLFHGFAEASIAEGKAFNFPKWGQILEKDMSLLPLVFTRQDDLLLTWSKPSTEHLQKLQSSGLLVPEIQQCPFDKPFAALKKRHARSLNPWGWSPYIHEKFKGLLGQNEKLRGWQEEFKVYFSKTFCVDLVQKFNAEATHDWFNHKGLESSICSSFDALKEQVVNFSTKWPCIVVKAPLGASGRNMLRLPQGEINPHQEAQLRGLLKLHGELIVEPWVERVLDFSLHFDLGEEVTYKGATRLINDERGQYSATVMANPWRGVSEDYLKVLHSANTGGLNGFGKLLATKLTLELKELNYKGPLGIDAFIYIDGEGSLQVRPMVEMNFRYTMGRVAMGFEKYIAPGRSALMKILSLKSKRDKHLRPRIKSLDTSIPEKNKKGLWSRGLLVLNEYSDDLCFPIVLSIGEDSADCEQQLYEEE
jgi:uncharacterized ferritin-like protein (DUF455 family)